MSKKVLFIVASEGFHPVEYGLARQAVEEGGYQVVVGSDKSGYAVTKKALWTFDSSPTWFVPKGEELQLAVEVTVADAKVADYKGVYFIGGPGSLACLDNQASWQLAQAADEATTISVGAICAAPRILGNAGILRGRHATGWNGDGKLPELMKLYGADYIPSSVVVDRLLITATGPDAATDFGKAIVRILDQWCP